MYNFFHTIFRLQHKRSCWGLACVTQLENIPKCTCSNNEELPSHFQLKLISPHFTPIVHVKIFWFSLNDSFFFFSWCFPLCSSPYLHFPRVSKTSSSIIPLPGQRYSFWTFLNSHLPLLDFQMCLGFFFYHEWANKIITLEKSVPTDNNFTGEVSTTSVFSWL